MVERNQLVIGFPMDEGVYYVQNIVDQGIMSPAYSLWDIDTNVVIPAYLEKLIHGPKAMEYFRQKLRGTTARRRIVPVDQMLKLEVPILSLKHQEEIINSLNKIDTITGKLEKLLDKLEQIVKSRFIELFEKDGQNNQVVRLEEIADIVSGITKGRKIKSKDLTNVPYMAVSNVKDGYIDLSNLKYIHATNEEIEKYHLISGDILMTEGGDPDKLGRGSIIIDPPKNCIHQNHIFRVRLDSSLIDPVYFSAYLQQPISKKYFLRSAKQTTGIASINMKQLRGMPVIIPSLEDQKEYKTFFLYTAKSKLAIQKSIDQLEILKKKLMQEYFG